VELLGGGASGELWPYPGRIFAVSPQHTFHVFAEAIDDAFARWDRSHLHEFELARLGKTVTEFRFSGGEENPERELDADLVTLGDVLRLGEEFTYTFDLGDNWWHRCLLADTVIDPDEARASNPHAYGAYRRHHVHHHAGGRVPRARDYRLEHVPQRVPGPGQALVRVEAVGICASDLKCYHGAAKFWGDGQRPAYVETPVVPGHEFAGEVVELDDAAAARWGITVGDRVVSEQIVPCWTRRYCRIGKYHMCLKGATTAIASADAVPRSATVRGRRALAARTSQASGRSAEPAPDGWLLQAARRYS
jgi:Alcohol dehydrogenase GroES-like domain/Plasmid pRiA4b ORF-3-like protein